jgi:hypothetical protein
MAHPQVLDGDVDLQIKKVPAKIMNNQSRRGGRGQTSSLGIETDSSNNQHDWERCLGLGLCKNLLK